MPDSSPILQLQKLAGRRTFDKGEMLYFQEAVHRFTKDQMVVSAIVQEVQEFEVKLSIVDGQYEGACNCSDSEGFDFCKHCVAVALTDISREAELKELQDGDEIQRITAYIEGMSEAQAKAVLLEHVTSDIDIAEQWVLFADVTNKKVNKKALLDSINKALPLREVWRQLRVKTYFENAIEKFNRLISILHKLPPEVAFELTQAALLRYNKALGKIKDDKGYRLKVEFALLQTLAALFKELDWPQERKIRYALSLYDEPYSNFVLPSIYKKFVRPMPELVPLFIKKLVEKEAQFDQHDTSVIKMDKRLKSPHRLILEDLSIYYAEVDTSELTASIGKLIECKHKLANNINDYIELAELCIEFSEKKKAKIYIAEMEKLALNYRQESKILTLNARVQEEDHDIESALALNWSAYQRSLDIKEFNSLVDLLKKSSIKNEQDIQDWFEKARAFLLEHIKTGDGEDPLFELYLACDKEEIAINEAGEAQLSPELLHKIAKLGIKQNPELGFALYRRLVRIYPKNTDTQGYETAIALLKELKAALKTKTAHQSFEFLISELSFDFKQKRKFIALLQAQFGL